MDLVNYKKELTLEIMNEKGHVAKRYFLHNCWVSEFTAVADLDANANAVAIENSRSSWKGGSATYRPRSPTRGLPSRQQDEPGAPVCLVLTSPGRPTCCATIALSAR